MQNQPVSTSKTPILQLITYPQPLSDNSYWQLANDTSSGIVELKSMFHPLFNETFELYKENFPARDEMDHKTLVKYLNEGILRVFISIVDSKVSACALIVKPDKNFDIGHLEYLFVNKKIQGQGIGTKFMHNLINFLKIEKKITVLTLECVESLIKFYQKFQAKIATIGPSNFIDDNDFIFYFLYIPIEDSIEKSISLQENLTQLFFTIRKSEKVYLHDGTGKVLIFKDVIEE